MKQAADKAGHRTAIPLRFIAAGELGRYAEHPSFLKRKDVRMILPGRESAQGIVFLFPPPGTASPPSGPSIT